MARRTGATTRPEYNGLDQDLLRLDQDLLALSNASSCRYPCGRCQHLSIFSMFDRIAMFVFHRPLLACWVVLSLCVGTVKAQEAQEHLAPGTSLPGIESPSNQGDGLRGAGLPDAGLQGVGPGGGSFADFQSLIDLIQTTVVPDTWEALGGPSTMAPYPQGVYVDANGTIRDCESFAETDAVAELKSLLSGPNRVSEPDQPLAWRQPSTLRCVSLQRLTDQWKRWQTSGLAPSDAMMQMAGISQVQYLIVDDHDIVIAGPVGGIEQVQGWYRDRQSGLIPLRLDFFRTCLGSSLQNQPFGCTIDPTQAGLQRAAAVGAAVQSDKIPIGKAAEEMVRALGMQRVEIFGTAGDTPIGYVMVEADRHMKQLALGIHPMPTGAVNYLDVIDASIDQGPPNELLLRLWFTSAPRAVRADADRTVFELAGTPIRLSGQNERAMASGQRGNVTHDFRTVAFVDDFNKNWHAIRSEYPIYGALESIYQTASIAELIRRFAETPQSRQMAALLTGTESQSDYLLPTPRQVESISQPAGVQVLVCFIWVEGHGETPQPTLLQAVQEVHVTVQEPPVSTPVSSQS